jgi:predicted amidohydrolase YtcJ
MMTLDAAYVSFDEQSKGSIEVGKLGDLVLLSDDLLTCGKIGRAPSEILPTPRAKESIARFDGCAFNHEPA